LRLFNEQLEIGDRSVDTTSVVILNVCQAFERATGWSLCYAEGQPPREDHDLLWSAPVDPGVGTAPGHFRIDFSAEHIPPAGPRIDLEHAGELAAAVASLTTELQTARAEIRKREAELATGVPVIERDGDVMHVAERLEAVLRGGAEAVGCHAAAAYLLDSATSELKLRSAWGLPRERLTLEPRALRTAAADLEALAGHAVVMKNRAIRAEWGAPEAAAAAVCVPISTANMPLGTLWIYSARERDFTDAEVNVIEIIAGRLASDLEREVLVREGVAAAGMKRQIHEAERLQEVQLPRAVPRYVQWDVDAWTVRGDRLGGDFYDWFPHGDSGLSVAVGAASGQGVAAAMLSNVIRTAIRAHADTAREPHQLLEAVNRALWQAAAGLQSAGLFYAILDETGRIRLATAGDVTAMLVQPAGFSVLSAASLPLARDPAARYRPTLHMLRPEEALVTMSGGELILPGTLNSAGFDAEAIARLIGRQTTDTAKQLTASVKLHLPPQLSTALNRDRTLLIVKRKPN
jgi:serine phosphatase RsbU (regulator of sigma subunit)